MGRRKRSARRLVGAREAIAIAPTLGGVVRHVRTRKGWTQRHLGGLVGVEQSWISEIESGKGGGVPLDLWVALGLAIGRPLAVGLTAALEPERRLADAGHLEMQEAVLAMTARHGWRGSFEVRTRASAHAGSVDVLVRDDAARRLLVLECWNTFGDLAAAARSTDRKVVEAAEAAIAIGGEQPYAVHACWLVRPTAANRELIRRYPGIFRARFTGSSLAWSRTLNEGIAPPAEPGIVWFDPARRHTVRVRLRV
jgi:transcriptional regulator with XRE-family HTH domain